MTIALDPDDLDLVLTPLDELDETTAAAPGIVTPFDRDEPTRYRDALGRLIGDVDITEIWERRHHLARGLGSFDDVLDLDSVDELLTGGGLRTPAVRMIADGARLPAERFVRPPQDAPGPGLRRRPRPGEVRDGAPERRVPFDGVVDPVRVNQLIANGATLVLQGLRLYLRSIDRFCAYLGAELGHPVHANAYLTPAGSRGAGPHWDNHSVFMRQIAGAKRWTVRAPVESLPRQRSTKESTFDTEVVGEYVLEPGDCLYLPRGYIHDGRAVDDASSVHITFGLHDPTTWAHWFREIVHDLADDSRMRETLPPRFADDPARVAEDLSLRRDLLVKALTELDVEATARQIIDDSNHREPSRAPGVLRSLMTWIDLDSPLRVAGPEVRLDVPAPGGAPDRLRLTTPTARLEAPAVVAPFLEKLLDGDAHPAREVGADVDDWPLRILVARLIAANAVRPCSGALRAGQTGIEGSS